METKHLGTEDVERVTSRDGTSIGFRRQGNGPPLLFVHGTTGDHKSWSGIAPYFESQFTVCAMDRRGRGLSGDAPDYAFEREVEDIVAVIEAIGERVSLFGHSFGGLCSLEAALHTDRIDKLILYEAVIPTDLPFNPDGAVERIQALIDAGELESAMEFMLTELAKIPEHELEAYRKTPLWQARIPLARTIPREMEIDRIYDFDPNRFADLRVPSMLLLGGDSPAIYRDSIAMLDAALPNSSVVILPGQQHMAHHSDPELLAMEVTRFLPS